MCSLTVTLMLVLSLLLMFFFVVVNYCRSAGGSGARMEDDVDGVRGDRRGERHAEGVGDTPQGRLNINHGHIGAGMRSVKASTSRPTVPAPMAN